MAESLKTVLGFEATDAIKTLAAMEVQLKSWTAAMRGAASATSKFNKDAAGVSANIKKNWPQYVGSIALPVLVNLLPGMAFLPEEYVTVPLGAKLAKLMQMVFVEGAGGAAGKGWQQFVKQVKGSKGAPKSFKEIYGQQGAAFGEEAIAGLAGRGVTAGVGKLVGPLKSKLTPGAGELSEILQRAGKKLTVKELTDPSGMHPLSLQTAKQMHKFGSPLTAAQKTVDPIQDWVENAIEGSIFGGNPVFTLKKILQPRAFEKVIDDLTETLWSGVGRQMSPDDVGKLFLDTIKGGNKAQQSIIRGLYGQIDKQTAGVTVDMTGVQTLMKQLAEKHGGSGLGPASAIKRLGRKVKRWPKRLSFMEAHTYQSNVAAEIRKLQTELGAKDSTLAMVEGKLRAAIKQQMKKTAQIHSPEAWAAYKTAAEVTKRHKKLIGQSVFKKAAKVAVDNPGALAKEFFGSNNIKNVKLLQKTMGGVDSEGYQAVRAAWMDQLMTAASRNDGKMFGKSIEGAFQTKGTAFLKAAFPEPGMLNEIRNVIKLGRLVQDPIGRGGGSMVIQLTQAGAIISIASGIGSENKGLQAGGTAILLGPAILGRLLTTKGGAKWLAEGFEMPKWSPMAGSLSAKILKAAYPKQKEAVLNTTKRGIRGVAEGAKKMVNPNY